MLYDFQKRAVEFLLANKKCALFLDMGLGKTLVSLTALEILKLIEGKKKILVVAPYMVAKHVWTNEILKWNIDMTSISLVNTLTKRRENLKAAVEMYVLNIECLVWLLEDYDISNIFDVLIIDESSMFKDSSSKRFKALKKVCGVFDRVILLSGTPTPNSLLEIWPQMYLIDQGKRLGKTKREFLDNYFYPGMRSGYIIYNYIIKKGAEEKIYEKISDKCLSIKNIGLIDMPSYTEITYRVSFSKKLEKAYNKLKKELALEFDNSIIDGVNAAVLIGKLQQFVNGQIYTEDKQTLIIHDLKIKALQEILNFSGDENVLVFYWYKHEHKRLNDLGIPDIDIDLWNAGKQKVALLHPARGGHGLNLQSGGSVMVWFSPIYSLELYQQAIHRLYRQGQTKPVKNYIICCYRSIDEQIIKVLSGKKQVLDCLLSALK